MMSFLPPQENHLQTEKSTLMSYHPPDNSVIDPKVIAQRQSYINEERGMQLGKKLTHSGTHSYKTF